MCSILREMMMASEGTAVGVTQAKREGEGRLARGDDGSRTQR